MPDNPRQICLMPCSSGNVAKKFADELLHDAQEKARFSSRDRGFFREMFFGVIPPPQPA
jgi:hypothetical protein